MSAMCVSTSKTSSSYNSHLLCEFFAGLCNELTPLSLKLVDGADGVYDM
jgi:hypothetical protein